MYIHTRTYLYLNYCLQLCTLASAFEDPHMRVCVCAGACKYITQFVFAYFASLDFVVLLLFIRAVGSYIYMHECMCICTQVQPKQP